MTDTLQWDFGSAPCCADDKCCLALGAGRIDVVQKYRGESLGLEQTLCEALIAEWRPGVAHTERATWAQAIPAAGCSVLGAILPWALLLGWSVPPISASPLPHTSSPCQPHGVTMFLLLFRQPFLSLTGCLPTLSVCCTLNYLDKQKE